MIIDIKKVPFDIFQEMLKDEGISKKEKNLLIKERGDKRFKEVNKWLHLYLLHVSQDVNAIQGLKYNALTAKT